MGNGDLPQFLKTTPAPNKKEEDVPDFLKKKVSGEGLSNGGTNGSFAGLLGGSVKSANIGGAAIKKLPIEDISEYNKRFEDITGHKEINLGSDLPQIAKAREEKKYLTYRDIEEYQIKPVLNDVASGVVQSEDLKKLYQQPYGKKIVSEVINQNIPEIGTMGLDEDVFGNEKKWETIAQSIQSKNRQQGVDAQNQQEFELDNELANSLKDYTYGQDHIAVRGGGEAVNERQQNAFGIVNTTSPSELSAALRNINNSSKVWDSEGNEVDKKLLAKKIGTRLFQIKAQENIHPEITQLSDKVKSAISKVPVEWKKQGMTDELLNRDAEYVIDGLNYIRDSDPGRYAMIMGTIYKLDKIAETDYQELVGLGKEINSFKKFKQGEYVEKDNRNFLTPQGKKALLGGWLYEELKRTGKNKQTFRIPQKDILEAYKNVPAELKDDDLLRDIIKDEVGPAFGFLPIAKGEGIPKRGLGRQILTNIADPFAGILKTADYSFDSPFDAYLKSKELDRGDNIVLNSKGEYTNKSSDTFFNKAVGGLFSFLSQVGIARGIGAVTAKGTNALIGQVAPRAATVTTSEAALNVGTPLSVIAQQYGDEYVDFLEKTGNPTKAALGAFVSTVTQGAIERFVLPDVKIADQAALLFARKNLAKDIINVVENGGGKVGVLKTIKDFAANTLSTLSKEAIAEENLQNFANYLTEMVVSPKTAQNRDLMQETEDITKAAVVQMAIPAVLGGAGETKIKRGLNKVQLNHIGVNAEDYQKALDNQFAMGKMLQEDYDLASGIIQLHRDNIINAPKYDSKGELISAERQLEYAYQSTVQETLQQQVEKQKDKVQREPIEKKIEEADKIKRQIFYGEEAEGLPPKEGQPITIDQDRDLMDEEGQDLSKDELLATLKSKAGELEQGMDLQYFKDKAAEDPAKYIEKYGEETVMDLIKDIPTETLKGNLDLFLDISPNAPSVKILDKIIAEREAAEALSTVSGKEVGSGVGGDVVDESNTKMGDVVYFNGQPVKIVEFRDSRQGGREAVIELPKLTKEQIHRQAIDILRNRYKEFDISDEDVIKYHRGDYLNQISALENSDINSTNTTNVNFNELSKSLPPQEVKAEQPTKEVEQQVKDFGVSDEMTKPVTNVVTRMFEQLKKVGLTTAKTVGDWVGIGKGTEKPYSLKIDGKDTQVKNVQPEVVNGFYSPLEKIITESKFDKLPAKQWAEKYANSEEAKWTGLKDWLAKQQGSVSKADIQQYLKDNRIQVVEVVNSGKSEKYYQLVEEQKNASRELDILESDLDNWSDENYKESRDKKYELNDKIKELSNQIKEEESKTKDTKFKNYQLEGQKENYKEVLVTLPIAKSKQEYVVEQDYRTPNTFYAVNQKTGVKLKFGSYELAKSQAERLSKESQPDFDKQFKSSHFDEPNILVHLRMNTRTDAEGNKVLFLEEVQSDWGQKGKKEGFRNEKDSQVAGEKALELAKKINEKYPDEVKVEINKDGSNAEVYKKIDGEWKRNVPRFKYSEEQRNYIDALKENSATVSISRGSGSDTAIPQAPFVTDTNAWTKLGLKVALKEAVKQGADKIAWTTGEQQNERYSLEKQVDEILYFPTLKEGVWDVSASKNDRQIWGEHADAKRIEAMLGKDIANKITKGEGEFLDKGNRTREDKYPIKSLRGDNLKVGGSQMLDSYGSPELRSQRDQLVIKKVGDKYEVGGKIFPHIKEAEKFKENYGLGIVGNVAKSLFKQEPKTIELQTTSTGIASQDKVLRLRDWVQKNKNDDYSYNDAQKDIESNSKLYQEYQKNIPTQHSITITPEMRAEVEGKGQPLFKDAEAQYRIESGKNIIEAIKDFNQSKNKARATVALTHEIMHPTVVAIIDGAKEGNEVGAKHTETIVNEFNKANPNSKVTVEDLIKGNDAFKDGTTSNQYRQVQEFIAKAWEKYHTEGGKGFSDAFQKVLEQITKAFQSVYKSITGKQLTPELKQMFDDILGKEAPPQYTEAATPAKKESGGVSGSALKDVESTAKALEGVDELKSEKGFSFVGNKKLKGEKHKGLNFDELINRLATDFFGTYGVAKSKSTIESEIDALERLLMRPDTFKYEPKKAKPFEEQLKLLESYRDKGIKNVRDMLISEAYHKAKSDGSNPELVKAVEELLGKPTEKQKTETTPTVSSEGVSGSALKDENKQNQRNPIIDSITDLDGSINKHFLREAVIKAPVLLSVNEKSIGESIGYLRKIANEVNDTELTDTVQYLEDAAKMVFAIKDLEGEKRNEFLSNSENFWGTKKPALERLKRLEDWSNVLKANTEKNKAERLLRDQYQQTLAEIKKRFVDEGQKPNRPKQIGEQSLPPQEVKAEQPTVSETKLEVNEKPTIQEADTAAKQIEQPTSKESEAGKVSIKDSEGAGKEPPPKKPPVAEKEKGDGRNKGVLSHLAKAKNIPEEARKGFEEEGLKYETKSQTEAAQVAKSIIDELGIDEAVSAAEAMKFDGDVNSLIFAEVLNQLKEQEDAATTPEEKIEAAKKFAEVGITYDKMARYGGRFNAAINYFYKKSPLGIVMMENAKRQADFKQWSKPKEQSWKDYYEELKKVPEFADIIKEQVNEALKKERAEARQTRKEKVHKSIDETLSKWAKKLSADLPPGTKKQGIGVDELFKAVGATMKKAYDAGEVVAKFVQEAIDYISDQLGTTTWDSEGFRKEQEKIFAEKEAKKPLTDEELKRKILDKIKVKLKGLTDKQREELIAKAAKKIIQNNGLDYEDFRKLIAEATGRADLTADEAAKMKDLVQKTNAVDDAAQKWRTEKTKEAEVGYRKAQIEATKATRDLNDMFQDKPDIIRRLVSMMQLNTLGVVSLVANVAYNVWNQSFIRFPIGVINNLFDRGISLFDSNYKREYATVEAQLDFWKALGVGSKEALQQIGTGLSRQDYLSKEVPSQFRPFKSVRDLVAWKQGKKNLTKAQFWDKVLQAMPQGMSAEIVARLLNVGDKPQRFGAEGAQAATFAKALGLKDIDKQLFIEFPREQAYEAYKAQGYSDEVAGQKADYIKEAIIKEGKRSTFQQDNLLNDAITRAAGVLGGKDSGTAGLAKSLVFSPYIKIPTNAFWSMYNMVNPEVAILQAITHAGIAKKFKNKGELTKASLQNREARYWIAHAIWGMAMRAIVISLVKSGTFVPSADDDESKKERDAASFFDRPGYVNVGNLKISNRWFGVLGAMGNVIAKKWKDMTPEQRDAQDDFWNTVFGGMEIAALKEMENGVFANSSSLLQSLNTGDWSRYGINTINLFANIIQPATSAQFDRAQLDYVPTSKGDNFLDRLNQNFAQRSKLYRRIFDVQINQKKDIWGKPVPKGGNELSRMFGISKNNPQLFGRVVYDDFLRSGDSGFLPPAVLPILNGQQLNAEQENKLIEYVGSEREKLVKPYINDMAEIDGFNAKYSQLETDEDKKFVLQYLYNEGRDRGVELFYQDYPEIRPKEEQADYKKEAQKDIFKTLQKYKK